MVPGDGLGTKLGTKKTELLWGLVLLDETQTRCPVENSVASTASGAELRVAAVASLNALTGTDRVPGDGRRGAHHYSCAMGMYGGSIKAIA